MKHQVRLTVNGVSHELLVEPRVTLLDAIRELIGLTGTKKGCDTGDCGACTVILNGKSVNACLCLAVEADGGEVLTIEGLKTDSGPDLIQNAFIEHGAIQCGFCTPGMILSAKALLENNLDVDLDESQVTAAISGNLCRCTGYEKIIQAIMSLVQRPSIK